MANHKSALKRARQNDIRRMRNRAAKTRLRNIVKKVRTLSAEGKAQEAAAALKEAAAAIDKAAKKNVVHTRSASRKVSRLARLVNSVDAG